MTATLTEPLDAALRWLSRRRDVDPRRTTTFLDQALGLKETT